MAASLAKTTAAGSAASILPYVRPRYLYGPTADFFLLGGLSLLLFPLLAFLPADELKGRFAFFTLILANFINHPHFAHSYQIFYRQFGRQLTSSNVVSAMRSRYILAGIVVPVILFGYFAFGIAALNLQWVAAGANIMALLVGWHYVKQGYGLLMVDAALKRIFFSGTEKRLLLVNSYAVWTAAWLFLNTAKTQRELWGIEYYSFNVPIQLVWIAALIVAATTLLVVIMLIRRGAAGNRLPSNGCVAYFTSLYLWLLFVWIDPLWALVAPALHSIQYLAVVYRFQSNREQSRLPLVREAKGIGILDLFHTSHPLRMTLFILTGMALGIAIFWMIPGWLDRNASYDRSLFGINLYLFSIWVSVNIHHYFIDNVIWRRENEETRKHLFEG